MKKSYNRPQTETIDIISRGYILAGQIGFGGDASDPGEDPDVNIDESKGDAWGQDETNGTWTQAGKNSLWD